MASGTPAKNTRYGDGSEEASSSTSLNTNNRSNLSDEVGESNPISSSSTGAARGRSVTKVLRKLGKNPVTRKSAKKNKEKDKMTNTSTSNNTNNKNLRKNPLFRLLKSPRKERDKHTEHSPLLGTRTLDDADQNQQQQRFVNPIGSMFRWGPNLEQQQQQQQRELDIESGHPSRQQRNREASLKAQKHWSILKDHVCNGDMLLTSLNTDNAEDRAMQMETRHEHHLQEKIDEIRRGMEFSLLHGLFAMFLYLGISIACFNTIFEPDWSILDSCYFAMVTVTTVGYGDEVPTSGASMIFTCLYAMSGVAILGIALGILGGNLVDAQEAMASKAETLVKEQVMSVFDSSKANTNQTDLDEADGEALGDETQELLRRPSLMRSTFACLKGFLPLMAFMLGMAYWIGHRAGWTILEITYFMIVTATTVGYGDFTPKSDDEKMIALLFIPVAVGTMGVWLGGFANIIVESRSARYRKNMGMKDLTQHDLEIMDSDGDGTVTRAEFLEFMLIAMNKIDQELVDELRQHFNRLDADGTGELTKQDLIEVARKKLKSPSRKLQLSVYKDRLLEHSNSRGGYHMMTKWKSSFFGKDD